MERRKRREEGGDRMSTATLREATGGERGAGAGPGRCERSGGVERRGGECGVKRTRMEVWWGWEEEVRR